MKVLKFGGAVLSSPSGFRAMLDILIKEKNEDIFLIISAFSLSTRNLIEAARVAETGDELSSIKILDSVIEEHQKFAREILTGTNLRIFELFSETQNKLKNLLRGISLTKELSPRTLDFIMSFGELLALHTVDCFLSEAGLDFHVIDATDIIITDSNYGKAKPLLDLTENNFINKIKPLFKEKKLVVMQGFVAKSNQNEITTMGLESSNLSAGLAALYLESNELCIYSNVLGIRTTDPQIISNTNLIPEINPKEAQILSRAGLKLIYPDMIELLKNTHTKIIYHSAFYPNEAGTVITRDSEIINPIILHKENIGILNFNISKFKNIDEIINIKELLEISFSGDYCRIISEIQELKKIKKIISDYNKKPENPDEYNEYYESESLSLITILNISENFNQNIFRELGDYFSGMNLEFLEFNKNKKILKFLIKKNSSTDTVKLLHDYLYK